MRLLWIFRTLRINFSWTIKLQAKIFSALIFICYPQRFTQPTFNQCSTYIVPKKIRKPPVFWFFPGYRSGTSIENRLRKEVQCKLHSEIYWGPCRTSKRQRFTAFHRWVDGFFPHTLCKICYICPTTRKSDTVTQ